MTVWFWVGSLLYSMFVLLPLLALIGWDGEDYSNPLFWIVAAPALPWVLCWLAFAFIIGVPVDWFVGWLNWLTDWLIGWLY